MKLSADVIVDFGRRQILHWMHAIHAEQPQTVK